MDSPAVKIEEEDHINEPEKIKTRKRKQSNIDDSVVVDSSKKRNIKGILLSITKPSYALKRGIGRELQSLRCEHRIRLRYLLRQMVRRRNWDELSGVLSVLLKATHRETSLLNNRAKYWATLKLFEHMNGAKLESRKALEVYDLWEKKDFAGSKNKQSFKGGSDVRLDFLVFRLLEGGTCEGKDDVSSIQQATDFANDPIANLVVGLAYSQRWYNSVPVEIREHASLEYSSAVIQSGISMENILTHSDGESFLECQKSGHAIQADLNTSIRIGKECVVGVKHEVKEEAIEYDKLDMDSEGSDQNRNSSRFLHTGDKSYVSIFYRDPGDLLMPLKFSRTNNLDDFISLQMLIQNDHYKAAVQYLQDALHCTPPAYEALLPLVQMLLYGDQVKEAIEEVESVVQNSHAALPFRLKASLLEHFSKEDAYKLDTCFEDALKKDPTCRHSLQKLISLHYDGSYSVERLTEMVALHLDATYGSSDIWREFSVCLINHSQYNDRMSGCLKSYGDDDTLHSKTIPDMFVQDKTSKENWKLRCRWWRTRHFSQAMLSKELKSGKLEVVSYKAVCACHLYGPECAYVVRVSAFLKKTNNKELLSMLKQHMENALGIEHHLARIRCVGLCLQFC